MGTKGSKATIHHPFSESSFVKGIKSTIPGSLLRDIAEDRLKAIELSNGDIVTLKNACALYEYHYYHRPAAAVEKKKRRKPKETDADLCLKFIEHNMHELLRSKKGRRTILSLSQEPLLRALQSDNLVVNSEYELLLLVAAWANVQIESGGKKTPVVVEIEKEKPKLDDSLKINLRESAGLFSQLAQGVSHMRTIIESGENADTADNQDNKKEQAGSEEEEKRKKKEQEEVDQKKKEQEEADKRKKEQEEADKKKEEEAEEAKRKKDKESETEEERRVREIRKRLEETEWEVADNQAANEQQPAKPKLKEVTFSEEDLLKDDDDDSAGAPQPMVNLRGTAGLFHHMSQGAVKVLKTKPEEAPGSEKPEEPTLTPEKEKEKEKETEKSKGNADEEDLSEVLKLIAALDESEDGWEPSPLLLPRGVDDADASASTTASSSTSTPTKTKTDDDDFIVPLEKLTDEYLKQLKSYMEPFLDALKFSCMSLAMLNSLLEEGLIPHHYIYEAHRVHYYKSIPELKSEFEAVMKANPKYKPRRYTQVDLKWNPARKHPSVQILPDGITATAVSGSGCGHKTVLANEGLSFGRHVWTVKLNQYADCYSAVGVVRQNFDVVNGQMGITPDSWALGLYAGTHCAASDRRKQASLGRSPPNTLARLELDMDIGQLKVFLNGKLEATYNGLTGTLFPALTLCELSDKGYTMNSINEYA